MVNTRLRRIAALTEEEGAPIRALQPDTTVTVYHGTTMQDAYEFCTVGIDGRRPVGRIYPHWSNNKPLKFGLFVAPDAKTALQFGRYAIEFTAHGRDLISRFPHEMKTYNPKYKEQYPQSFRPLVSDEMLTLNMEPQALYIGLANPSAIMRVWALKNNSWDQMYSMSREEFVKHALYQKVNDVSDTFHPDDYKMTLDDFLQRFVDREGAFSKEEILKTLLYIYRRDGHLSGIGDVPYSLLRRIERQLDTYIRQHPEDVEK